ncbi:MAG: phosphatidylinositol mannoside acyltransferase [Ruaniaceae bacterium]|nr:phosphatidylinositol mannoside acyltransferase [Ruaniaceae bacterium]
MDAGNVFTLAWRVLPRLPEGLVTAAFAAGADYLWRRRMPQVRQLEANLRRVLPAASEKELRATSRAATRSYAQYYAEIFTAPGLSREEILRRITIESPPGFTQNVAEGSVVLALGHTGNWDYAGFGVSHELNTVLTVAEVLEPPEIFEDFLAFREAFGIEIIPLRKGTNVFSQLRTRARESKRIVALLADRDLTHNGIEVELVGHRARVAAGPAALSHSLKIPLYYAGIRHTRVPAPAFMRPRRTVGGITVTFIGPISVEPGPRAVERLSQAWADVMSEWLRQYPESWHMLQKVFVADLDPDRLTEARSA